MYSSSAAVRILVVEDFEPFRCFLRATLEARPELQVIGEASDGLEAVQKARELQPDLILLDIGLPKLNGIEVAHQIRELVTAPIIFVSQDSDADVVAAALSDGAKGYVHKQHAYTDLLPAVKAVLRGAHFVSKALCGDAQPIGSSYPAARMESLPELRCTRA
jgi:DNA-binding NarL/FixJ family response regulator